MRILTLLFFALACGVEAQTTVNAKLVNCGAALSSAPFSVVVAFLPPGSTGTTRRTVCMTLDPGAFVVDASTNPPTIRVNLPPAPPTSDNLAESEVPAGLIDAKNGTFTLAHTPKPGSLKVYYNGLRLKEGADYSAIGNTFTFITDSSLWPSDPKTDLLLVDYRY